MQRITSNRSSGHTVGPATGKALSSVGMSEDGSPAVDELTVNVPTDRVDAWWADVTRGAEMALFWGDQQLSQWEPYDDNGIQVERQVTADHIRVRNGAGKVTKREFNVPVVINPGDSASARAPTIENTTVS